MGQYLRKFFFDTPNNFCKGLDKITMKISEYFLKVMKEIFGVDWYWSYNSVPPF